MNGQTNINIESTAGAGLPANRLTIEAAFEGKPAPADSQNSSRSVITQETNHVHHF
jgi:hypothetical protein